MLNNLIADLRNSRDDDDRSLAAENLCAHVEAEARDMFGERFNAYMTGLNTRILELVNSTSIAEKLGGIAAIDRLINLETEENATKITRFATHIQNSLPHANATVTEKVAEALGHLARAGGTLTAEFVEFEVRRALEWLRETARYEPRRHASVLVLRELARNSPVLIYAHMEPFFRYIWVALRDTKIAIREIACQALRECLQLTARREHSARSDWYPGLFQQVTEGCKKNEPDSIHGSLLAVGELLEHAEEFMMDYVDEAFDLVLHYRDHRNSTIRRAVIGLLPRLAQMRQADDAKKSKQLSKCVSHLLLVLRQGSDRSVAFVALGQLALAQPKQLIPHLKVITQQVRDSTNPRSSRKAFCVQAVECVGMLTRALGPEVAAHVDEMFDSLFNGGLSKTLIDSLVEVVKVLPSFVKRVNQKLLNAISMTLAGQPYAGHGDEPTSSNDDNFTVPTGSDPTTNIILALNTLSTFEFGPAPLMYFMHNAVLELLEDDSRELRREAVTACARMLEKTINCITTKSRYNRRVADAIGGLLQVGIADESPDIRLAVLQSLHSTFDRYLAQAGNIRSLYLAINDENSDIRQCAVVLLGRLTDRNPAYVLPCLRTTLIQLLAEMSAGDDGRLEGESAKLLGLLIRSSPRLAGPYVAPVLAALTRRLEDPGGCTAVVAANVLGAIGELSAVGSELITVHADKLFGLAIEGIQDQSSTVKRQASLRALGQLVQSTGRVIQPYIENPHLLPTVLAALRGEPQWEVRREVIKVIGILGAVDPRQQALAAAQVESREEGLAAGSAGDAPSTVSPSSDDFYPTVAISGLMRILRDQSLSQHSNMVVQAVMSIFISLGMKCVPFLKDIVSPMLNVISRRSCEPGLRDFLFQQLGDLVSIVKQHIRPYLPKIFELIVEYFDIPVLQGQILGLVEKLAIALSDEFKPYLSKLVPQMLSLLRADRSAGRDSSRKVLHAFEVFGANIDQHLHLVIPEVVQMFNQSGNDRATEFQCSAIRTAGYLCCVANVSDFASRIVHPIVRVLDSTLSLELREEAMTTLCNLIYHIGDMYKIFIPTLKKIMLRKQIQHDRYETLIKHLERHEPFPPELGASVANAAQSEDASSKDRIDLAGAKKPHVNQKNLRKAWETSQRSTQDDWDEWMRRFSVELLRESSSPALRACSALAQVYHPLARELFNAAFVSCYTELEQRYRDELVRSLEQAFTSPFITPDILQVLLNLAELMERDEKPLPIDLRILGSLAMQCHAYAKGLRYKELEFQTSPDTAIEELITINNKLGQHEAAVGVLKYTQEKYGVELKESWHEKLNRWRTALEAYELRRNEDKTDLEATTGMLRCLNAMGLYTRVSELSVELWRGDSGESVRRDIAPIAATAAWGLGKWDELEEYVGCMRNTVDSNFFSAILAISKEEYKEAHMHIENSRDILDKNVTALVGESYNRAYDMIVTVQQLAELEEVIEYKQAASATRQKTIQTMWQTRLLGARRDVMVWVRLLNIRRMVIPSIAEPDIHVKFVSLCAKSRENTLATTMLASMMNCSQADVAAMTVTISQAVPSIVTFSYLQFLWLRGSRHRALSEMQQLANKMAAADNSDCPSRLVAKVYRQLGNWQKTLVFEESGQDESFISVLHNLQRATEIDRGWYKAWHDWALMHYEIVTYYERKVRAEPKTPSKTPSKSRGGQSASAVSPTQTIEKSSDGPAATSASQPEPEPQPEIKSPANPFDVTSAGEVDSVEPKGNTRARPPTGRRARSMQAYIHTHIVPAANGFFQSIALSEKDNRLILQDILRLITLWFKYGDYREMDDVMVKGFDTVSIDNWLQVIPQLIARIHSTAVQERMHDLLCRIAQSHPQALIFPLAVTTNSPSLVRKERAQRIMDSMRKDFGPIVEQALLAAKEQIRVAILWHEMWHEGLEEASRLWFAEKNVDGMFQTLAPLHKMMEQGSETMRENSFLQAFGRDLEEALKWCNNYSRTRRDADLNQAWDLYYHVFRRITRQLPQMTTLELQTVSPRLLAARNMQLAVPGTYRAGVPPVLIESFIPTLTVIPSKQRPRKLTMKGSDGRDYMFLLKGHEDIRQDERVMQLFGLINGMLERDHDTINRDLSIRRYDVVPLSPNSGLIGWVAEHDTLHALIRDYRDTHKIILNVEHRLMLQMAPDWDHLTVMQKIEVFQDCLQKTNGEDLKRVMWLKSRSAEAWLDRRTSFTRSLATMSMIGYILGLGDRHPSNLLLDRVSGKVLHIDFGDCFEVAINREKFPEKVPFRLTRMLTQAMEVSGIEGNFRLTCESVMRVLRKNRSSVMAMLEAFVYDPLVNWRLNYHNGQNSLKKPQKRPTHTSSPGRSPGPASGDAVVGSYGILASLSESGAFDEPTSMRKRPSVDHMSEDAPQGQMLNERAVAVIQRVSDKLKGQDFTRAELDVADQVQKLFDQATSVENLCQNYIGCVQ
jgi:FKBP12-rapamycin complex-associated protein